jgi:16S rRNA processing protein RimM
MVDMQNEVSPIIIGKIVGVYGIKGWFKVLSFTRPKENILEYDPWLVKQNEEWQEMPFVEGKTQGKGLIACFEGITDRDKALSLVGTEIAIKQQQLPATREGEFYWHHLINMQVVNEQNEILGVVTELLETGANDVLVVEAEKQRYLIPYVQDVYIKDIDIEQGIMQVDWQSDI